MRQRPALPTARSRSQVEGHRPRLGQAVVVRHAQVVAFGQRHGRARRQPGRRGQAEPQLSDAGQRRRGLGEGVVDRRKRHQDGRLRGRQLPADVATRGQTGRNGQGRARQHARNQRGVERQAVVEAGEAQHSIAAGQPAGRDPGPGGGQHGRAGELDAGRRPGGSRGEPAQFGVGCQRRRGSAVADDGCPVTGGCRVGGVHPVPVADVVDQGERGPAIGPADWSSSTKSMPQAAISSPSSVSLVSGSSSIGTPAASSVPTVATTYRVELRARMSTRGPGGRCSASCRPER